MEQHGALRSASPETNMVSKAAGVESSFLSEGAHQGWSWVHLKNTELAQYEGLRCHLPRDRATAVSPSGGLHSRDETWAQGGRPDTHEWATGCKLQSAPSVLAPP